MTMVNSVFEELFLEVIVGKMGSGKTVYGLARTLHLKQMARGQIRCYFWSPHKPPLVFPDGTEVPQHAFYYSNEPNPATLVEKVVDGGKGGLVYIDEGLIVDWTSRRERARWKGLLAQLRHARVGVCVCTQNTAKMPTYLFEWSTHITILGPISTVWARRWISDVGIEPEFRVKRYTQQRFWNSPDEADWVLLEDLALSTKGSWPIEWPRKSNECQR